MGGRVYGAVKREVWAAVLEGGLHQSQNMGCYGAWYTGSIWGHFSGLTKSAEHPSRLVHEHMGVCKGAAVICTRSGKAFLEWVESGCALFVLCRDHK